MLEYLIRRILTAIPMLIGISLLVFFLMYITPGDVLSEARASRDITKEYILEMEEKFGLNEPWYVQYGLWLKNAVQLDFGESWTYRMPVFELLGQRVKATLTLSICSLIFAWGIAVPLGVLAAIKKDTWIDKVSSIFAYAALSVPEFFLALLAIYFAAQTGWFPIGGRTSITHAFMSGWQQFWDLAYHLVLPTIVLGIGGIAGMMRVMRANFLDHIRSEYVMTARAKGLPENTIMFKHVLRNAINPLITSLGFAFSGLLSGALLVETIMNYPGLGQLVYESFLKQDQYVVMAAVMIGCVLLMAGNFLADILLAWSDPRIRIKAQES